MPQSVYIYDFHHLFWPIVFAALGVVGRRVDDLSDFSAPTCNVRLSQQCTVYSTTSCFGRSYLFQVFFGQHKAKYDGFSLRRKGCGSRVFSILFFFSYNILRIKFEKLTQVWGRCSFKIFWIDAERIIWKCELGKWNNMPIEAIKTTLVVCWKMKSWETY